MRKISVILMVILILLILFVSCVNRGFNSTYSVIDIRTQIGVNESGIFEIIDNKIWFYDFNNKNKVIFCNRPNCNHEPYSMNNLNPSCNAVLPFDGTIIGAAMYNDSVYTFARDKLNHTVIYKQNPDSNGRELLSEFDWGIYEFNKIVLQDEKAYFIAEKFIIDDNFQNTKTDILLEGNEIGLSCILDDIVVYTKDCNFGGQM